MKKYLPPLLLLIFVLFGNAAFAGEDSFQSVRLIIDNSTTQADLESMQNFMEENGYSLQFDEVTFDPSGHVTQISGSVDFGKASGSFDAHDLSRSSLVIKKTLTGKLMIRIQAC